MADHPAPNDTIVTGNVKALQLSDLDQLIKQSVPEYGTNKGCGHVWERPDGARMRCGGPGRCRECNRDQQLVDMAKDEIARRAVSAK